MSYGTEGQLLQRPATKELLIQLRNAGIELDPRVIRPLLASDTVTANQGAASATQRWYTNARDDPTWAGVYSFAINDIPGNNTVGYDFVVLFNPVGNTKNLILLQAGVSDYSLNNVNTKNSIYLQRITATSGGTLQAASAINKYDTAFPNATAQVITANPTTTLGAIVAGFPPNQLTGPSTTAAQRKLFAPPVTLVLHPGEGVTLTTAAAGTNAQNYDFEVIWAEK